MKRDAAYPGAEAFLPERPSLQTLRDAAAGCRGCPLWKDATQTVFGEGPPRAPLVLVGEQPGDREDRAGRPFVGPAGRVLDESLGRAGLSRADVYVTNAVKHFKWRGGGGKKRIHDKPGRREIRACFPWVENELDVIGPDMLVLLGSSAAQAFFGPDFRLTDRRGIVLETPSGMPAVATVHPSWILRARPESERGQRLALFVSDLRTADRYRRERA